MVEIKTDTALEKMREAGRVVGQALEAARDAAAVGVSLRELDQAAHTVLTEAGARSPFLGYRPSFAPTPFPAVICASVNDALVHGIPDDYRLRDGDLVSIDCGAELGGWTGDAAISFIVGTPSRRPGTHRRHRAGTGRGHRRRHRRQPHRRHRPRHQWRRPRRRLRHADRLRRPRHRTADARRPARPQLRAARPGIPPEARSHPRHRTHAHGRGQSEYRTDPDGWTLRTIDGSRAAHVEHTIAITEDGPRILTLP